MNKMKYLVILVCCGLSFHHLAEAQGRAAYDSAYQEYIQMEYIRGVYIPADMDEAIDELIALSPESELAKLAKMPEDELGSSLRFGLGRWIEVKWNLYDGSRYSHYLKEMGITFPDDMIEFTIVSLHRYLNEKEQDAEARAEAYFKKRKAEHEERMSRSGG